LYRNDLLLQVPEALVRRNLRIMTTHPLVEEEAPAELICPKRFGPTISQNISSNVMHSKYSQTVAELKEMCKDRGLPVSGTKAVLIERLEG
jgi:hypothetical protein